MNILENSLLFKNTSKSMKENDNSGKIVDDSFVAIVARAGTGKTALIVQLAIDAILQNNNILHVSLSEPLEKVTTWYKEVLNNLIQVYDLGQNIDTVWESICSHRFIMTYKVEKFSVPTLKERLKDLTEQQIFKPNVIIIDGLPFSGYSKSSMESLKILSEKHQLHIWFTAIMHRHENNHNEKDLPKQIATLGPMFDEIIHIKPKNDKIYVESSKKTKNNVTKAQYFLDPSSMLLTESKI